MYSSTSNSTKHRNHENSKEQEPLQIILPNPFDFLDKLGAGKQQDLSKVMRLVAEQGLKCFYFFCP